LPVWQEAARLCNRVLDLLETPELSLSAAFRNQLERAALSVSNNIAEGFERVTTQELAAFLAIARGSAGEVRSCWRWSRTVPASAATARRSGKSANWHLLCPADYGVERLAGRRSDPGQTPSDSGG